MSLKGKGFKGIGVVALLLVAALVVYFLLTPSRSVAESKNKIYKGTVYSATHGGHMVFTTITIDGEREMISGSVAGRLPMPNNEQADAIEMSPDQKYIYYPTWDTSTLYVVDISDKKNPKVVAETSQRDSVVAILAQMEGYT